MVVLVIPSACGGTLQACIDSAAPGDTIVIGPDDLAGGDGISTTDESILITRSLTLSAAPGIDAVFGVDRYIRVSIAGAANASVSLADLTLRNGAIDIVDAGNAAGDVYRVERVRVQSIGRPEVVGCAVNASLGSPPPQHIKRHARRAQPASARRRRVNARRRHARRRPAAGGP